MADVPWWARGPHPDDEPDVDDGPALEAVPPLDTPVDTLDTPVDTPAAPLPGERVMCGACGLPARWLPDAVVEQLHAAEPVTGACAGAGHGPWVTATAGPGDDFLATMRRSGGGAP